MSTVYSADDIVGSSLYAKARVPVKWLASDSARPFVWIEPGELVGVVNSYLMPNAARQHLYWQFINSDGTPYYAEHAEGRFDLDSLQEQGVKTTEQKLAEADQANMSLSDKILAAFQSIGTYGVTALAVVLVVVFVVWLISKRV